MKISYNEATAMGCSILEKDLILCEKIGYDFIEIRLDMLKNYLEKHKVTELKNFFDNNRIKPHAFNALFDINFCDKISWKKILNEFMLACKTGEKIGSNYIVVVPTATENSKLYTKEEIFEDSVKKLIELSNIGKDYGMKIGFEPVGGAKYCVKTIQQSWEIVKYINHQNVGLTFDAFNLYLYNKLNDFSDMKMIDVEKLYVVHIDDSDDLPIELLDHVFRCFPGEGVINLKSFIGTLKDMGYKGMISVEIFRPEYYKKDAEWVIKRGYETTKKILNDINNIQK